MFVAILTGPDSLKKKKKIQRKAYIFNLSNLLDPILNPILESNFEKYLLVSKKFLLAYRMNFLHVDRMNEYIHADRIINMHEGHMNYLHSDRMNYMHADRMNYMHARNGVPYTIARRTTRYLNT